MPTIKDLFKDQNKDLYGLSGKTIIETKGAINPPRVAALALASPNAAAGMVGNQVAGLIKGSAKRPSDTIFPSDGPFAKPISATSAANAFRKSNDNVEPGKQYFVKTEPDPLSNFSIKNAIKNPIGTGINAAKDVLRNPVGAKNTINKLKNALKDRRNSDENGYGTTYQTTDFGSKPLTEVKKYSTHYPTYTFQQDPNKGTKGYVQSSIKERSITKNNSFDVINESILHSMVDTNELNNEDLKNLLESNEQINTPYVLFQKYGSASGDNILLPGTISGLSEQNAPEWTPFKFIGSPFNSYKYMGVERSISFELKLYYYDEAGKITMKQNLDKLRKLVFPDENISAIKYPNNGGYSPLSFNGNFAYLTINGLYYGILGYLENLSITIDESTSWATTAPMNEEVGLDGSYTKPYPTVVNVSIGFKVINEMWTNSDKGGDVTANYWFTGLEPRYIKPSKIQKSVLQNNESKPKFDEIKIPIPKKLPTPLI